MSAPQIDLRAGCGMADPQPAEREPDLAGHLLDLLVGQHPALLSIDELDRVLADPDEDPDEERFLMEEAVKVLVGDGLAHRLGAFVFASRAGVSAAGLLRA
jgi:hypothetical protein